MYPELFELPFIHVTVKTYGLMIVIGFLCAVFLVRKLARAIGQNPDHVTNVALYALIAGIIGARIFYVVHHFSQFQNNLLSIFAVWNGGLEFLGGVILAVVVIVFYLRRYKLPVRQYLDILVIGLAVGMAFGRIGCFFFGCCFGKPTNVAWAVRFGYDSPAYRSQAQPDLNRNRLKPYLDLPVEYFGYLAEDGQTWYPANNSTKAQAYLKPFGLLSENQKYEVTKGKYRSLPVHPSQLYAAAYSFFICAVLYLFWRKFGLKRPGTTMALLLILYGLIRFSFEFLRDDNPFEYGWWTIHNGWTVSQNLGSYLAISGLILIAVFAKIKPGSAK